MHPHHRAYYRLRYPSAARPVFLSKPTTEGHPVVDCSEQGFRFRPPAEEVPAVGATAAGEIQFRSGSTAKVSGVVVRVQGDEVAVHLTEMSIPFAVVLQEQLFLRKRYPFALC